MNAWSKVSAAELREQFDRSFSEARTASPVLHDVLAVQVAGQPYAIRLSEIGGLFVDRPLAPLPASGAAVLGLAGFRGAIVPVFDLGILLGHPTSAAPRWIVIAAKAPIGLAFDGFDGHLRVPHDAIAPRLSADPTGHVVDVVRDHGMLRPVIAINMLTAALAQPLQET